MATYKETIASLIRATQFGIDTDIQVGGRPPSMASSEFLTNKEQGDWAEQVVFNAINEGSGVIPSTPRHSPYLSSLRRNRLCKNSAGIQLIKPTPPFPCPRLAIPAQAGIQRIKRALRAPSGRSERAADSHKLAPPPAGAIARMCAFRALFALDSRLRGNGGYLPWPVGSFSGGSGFSGFLHSLESRNPSCELGIPYEIPAFAGMTEKSRNDRQTE